MIYYSPSREVTDMSMIYHGVFCVIIGYFIGGINAAYIAGRLRGFDIRTVGSRNAGGSNAIITMGKLTGAICCLFDIFKAYAAIKLAMYLFPSLKFAFALTSTSVILGHMFPIFMHFKGGKGLACLGGSLLAYNPKVFLVILLIEFVLLLIVNYLCVVPITSSIAYPVVYGVLESSVAGACILIPVTVAMVCKHIENLKRISQGAELHFSYMWNKEAEKERITKNIREISEEDANTLWRDNSTSSR